MSSANWGMYSNAARRSPTPARRRPKRSSAACGEAQPTKVAARAFGFGNSFRTAAVMTPIGQDHLDAERQLARVAVAQHRDASGVGGQIPADAARAFGGEREREQAIGRIRGLLHSLQDAAGLDR